MTNRDWIFMLWCVPWLVLILLAIVLGSWAGEVGIVTAFAVLSYLLGRCVRGATHD